MATRRPLDRVQVSCELTRRQLLAGHVGTWLGSWPGPFGALGMLGIVAFVLAMAWRVSPWFLLSLIVLFPAWTNSVRFVAGLARLVPSGRARVDVVVEADRIGRRAGQEWYWVPRETIDRVGRFGGVWILLKPGDISIHIPAPAIDDGPIAHIRAAAGKRVRA